LTRYLVAKSARTTHETFQSDHCELDLNIDGAKAIAESAGGASALVRSGPGMCLPEI
jgi:hypothetical protein